MVKKLLKHAIAAAALLLGSAAAVADDIDIYSGNTSVSAEAPNVLIVMDNTANWSQSFGGGTKFSAELTALATVVSALKTQFNLGLMMFTETGSPNTNIDGGYVRFAVQPMTDSTGAATDARNCLLKMVGSGSTCGSSNSNYSLLDIGNDKSNGGKGGVTMGEVYDYFAGLNAYAGKNKVKADPLAFLSGTIAGPQYKSPTSLTCQRNYVIVINNGPFQDNSSDTATATSQLSAAGGSTTVINPPDNGSSSNNESDEWVRFINKVSTVAAVTYTLEVGPSTNGQGPYNTSLLQSMGRQGKGGYYSAVDAATLLAALTRIFNDINAKNSVFASSSLPLSSDNSGAFLNQVYMGVFRPDAGGGPRWLGNLKQYQFAVDTNKNLYLADALGAVAAGSTGFAQPDAVSFWTTPKPPYYDPLAPSTPTTAPDATATPATNATTGSTGGFWYFDAKGSGGSYDSADGEWVEKGGAAQQLRLAYLGYGGRGGIGTTNAATLNGFNARQVYTCTGTCPADTTKPLLSATPFDTSNTNITDAKLGTAAASVSSISRPAAKSVSALSAGTAVSIASISKSSNAGSATTSTAHGMVAGDQVIITNTTNGLDGTYNILTAPTTTTFTFAASNGNSSATSGTATKTSTTAVATSAAHGFVVGQRVTVAGATPTGFNGAFSITAVTANTFSYTMSTAQGTSATGTLTATSNIATATATAHGLTTGDSATIAGASPAQFNGVFVVTVVDANTFTYVTTTLPTSTSASGTMTASVGGGRTTLIGWVRGVDTQDENGFKVANADTDVRASIHGDVLHSRPVVLNYSASSSSNNVYIFYGGNDGVFRAVKGGQDPATDGKEQWAFIPEEFFGKLKRQYNNSPGVKYPSTPSGLVPTPVARDYFFDGPVGSYIERNSNGNVTKAYLYLAMRRGGRFIYALDVTSPTVPKLLWRKSSGDSGFGELGQTWSQPFVAKIHANTNPVLIFGAGYDAASEDPDTPAATDTMGRAIYVLDAYTGAIVWVGGNSAITGTPSGTLKPVSGMNFSVAADVLVMDRTQDGYADRIYAADVGGNVWRVDIDDAAVANWNVWKIGKLADRSVMASTRKFLFGPDVVFGDTFDAVIVGSGDREHPLQKTLVAGVPTVTATQGVANRIYMLKDTHIGTVGADLVGASPLAYIDTCGSTVSATCSSLFNATGGGAVPVGAQGWSLDFATGEKVINGPLVTGGHVIFGTNAPDTSNTSCQPNLGIARRYDVSYLTGLGAGAFTDASGNVLLSEVATGGGFLPSPVSGVVEISGTPYLFTTDNPLNPGGVIPIKITVTQKRFRTYWKERIDQ